MGKKGADEGDDPAPADRTCAQCQGPIDGKEQQVAIGDRVVWLHSECEWFFIKDLKDREGPPW